MAINEVGLGIGRKLAAVPAGDTSGAALLIGAALVGVLEGNPDGVQTVAAPATPGAGPTIAAAAGSTGMAAGVYSVGFTYKNGNGETPISPLSTVTLTLGQQINVTAFTFPANVNAAQFYVSPLHDNAAVQLGPIVYTGAAFAIIAVGAGAVPPTVATASALQSGVVNIAANRIWSLTCKAVNDAGNSAIAAGDKLYIVMTDTVRISKKATSGYPFGIALGAVPTGTSAAIDVLLLHL